MAVNFNLLAQQGPQNLYEGFAQGQEQSAKNALMQQKMAQEQQMNALRREQTQLGMQQTRAEMAGAEEDRARKRRAERVGMYRERILRAATPEAAREIVRMQFADPEFGPMLAQAGTLEQSLAEVPDDPAAFEQYRQQEATGMTEWMKSQLPKIVGNAIYLPGENRFVTPPQKEAATRTPIAVLQNGRPVYVSPEQAVGQTPFTPATVKIMGGGTGGAAAPAQKAPAGYRFTPTGDLEPIPGGPAAGGELLPLKERQKREAALPQARQAVSTVTNTMSVIEQTIDRLLQNEDGLNGITGFVGGRTPGVTDAARKAQADIEQLKNLAFVQGITELRNASKTGAGVGNVSNKEGDRFENLKASLDRTQSLSDMKASLQRLKTQANVTKSIIQDAFDETYQYRGGPGEQAQTATPSDRPAGVGADWTLMTDKNGNKAWVSPDRKTFKEVK